MARRLNRLLRGKIANMASLLALAQGAKLYKYSRPCMTQRNIIDIKGGRSDESPLQLDLRKLS